MTRKVCSPVGVSPNRWQKSESIMRLMAVTVGASNAGCNMLWYRSPIDVSHWSRFNGDPFLRILQKSVAKSINDVNFIQIDDGQPHQPTPHYGFLSCRSPP